MMHNIFTRPPRVPFVVLAVLIVASLACSTTIGGAGAEEAGETGDQPVGGPAVEQTEEPPEEKPTAVPPPEATGEPVEEPPVEPTKEPEQPEPPEPTAEPEAVGINVDNVRDIRERRQIIASASLLSASAFSPTGHHAVSFGYDKIVRVWDADTGDLVTELLGHSDWGIGLAYSPDGTMLVSGGRGGDVIMWEMPRGSLITRLKVPAVRVYDVAWTPSGDRFAVGGESSSRVTVFDRSGAQLGEVKSGSGWVWSVAFSDAYLAAASDSGTIYIYNTGDLGSVEEIPYSGQTPARGLAFSPDGSLLAGCYRDGMLNIWNTADWSLEKTIEAHPDSKCMDGVFSLNGDLYFSVGDDGRLYAWNVKTGAALKMLEFDTLIWSVSLSGDGTLLALSMDNGIVRIVGLPE
jgi:WD40 repeat protein